MTIEDAYKILKETSPYIECANCEHFCESCLFDKAYDDAVKALEKQIHKKPIQSADAIIIDRFRCPVCKEGLYVYGVGDELMCHQNYCDYCGQAIDWSK